MAGQRILFIRLRSLGDTVLMTPALAVAKHDRRNVVGVVSEEPFDQVLIGNPHVDEIFTTSRRRKIVSRLRVIRSIRKFNADLVVDLHGGTTSAYVTALSGARKRVGFERSRNAWLYNLRVPAPDLVWEREQLHTVEDQLAPLKFLGFPIDPIPPLWAPGGADDEVAVSRIMNRQGIEDGFALIHPAAAFDTKQWQADRFAQLADRLTQDGFRIVVTAGPGEESVVSKLCQNLTEEATVVEPLSLGRFSRLVARCAIYIGNDTGTTHIAAALRKPLVVVFGSSDPKVWHPWGTRYRLVTSDLTCIPCPGYHCLHYSEPKCIRSIEVETVHKAVTELIQ